MVTLIIIAVTSLVSILCFTGALPYGRMLFNAYSTWHRKEWYRLFSYGLVHGGWAHLLFNMITLYFFGRVTEQHFGIFFGETTGIILYIVLYVSALAVSSIADLVKYKDDIGYNAVGASGAVSAVLFASILFEPEMGIYIFPIPFPIPAVIFAPLYLLYCWWAARKQMDNIGHSAHFWGALYGFLFPLILKPGLIIQFIHYLSNIIP
jgi:membrane associated rhomboid family serine protease